METQTNVLELDGVEWASPGAGRVSFVSHFCEVHPPTLVSVPVQNLKTKYGTNKKGTLPDWNSGSSNFIILE